MGSEKYNICIVRPDGFIHSMAFVEVAEALGYSLRALGHQSVVNFNAFAHDAINIIFGAHLLTPQDIADLKPNTVIVNAEPLSAIDAPVRERILTWLQTGLEIWDYSRANIEILSQIGGRPAKYLQLGFQNELDRITPAPHQDIDVLFYGSMNDRRAAIIDGLRDRGLAVKRLFNAYGRDRDIWIARSKTVLNMHFFDAQIFEVVRVFYLLSNGVPVVGEVNGQATQIEERFTQGIVAAPYDELIDVTEKLVRDPERLARQRIIARDAITPYPQTVFTQMLL
ncbi:hypothetical protein GOZ78_11450 [Agrobacterium vitis]|uniref:Glycosyltransferase n=2 Tax=Agrobacterium vitis TaxID=373 RepID=A0ABD6GBP2_AGRVI|nr:hypothetical protein [Agrobacterium vitis]MUO97091.1 hypothetical protein [Agrobacterium vitis]MUP06362.1 hypothetical protein [Agrobacterium vitis]MUZ83965.1 hypothetical protein [Agrobacterium vitis]MVA10646.1 hypothetical protein [Agrobacterium vitis]